MSILFCRLYVNIRKMKTLKELDRQASTERFTTRQDCYEFLAELKWEGGHTCKRCSSNARIKGRRPAGRRCSKCGHMSPRPRAPHSTSSNLTSSRPSGCSMGSPRARRERTVSGWQNASGRIKRRHGHSVRRYSWP